MFLRNASSYYKKKQDKIDSSKSKLIDSNRVLHQKWHRFYLRLNLLVLRAEVHYRNKSISVGHCGSSKKIAHINGTDTASLRHGVFCFEIDISDRQLLYVKKWYHLVETTKSHCFEIYYYLEISRKMLIKKA